MASSNPFTPTSNFVDLLNSQQDPVLADPFGYDTYSSSIDLTSQLPVFSSPTSEDEDEMPGERRPRKKWMPSDDVMLISAWLNTSKDPLVGNEQKSTAFWKRIASYVAASPNAAGRPHREPIHCKNRWRKIHQMVSKFCGSYDAAVRDRTSGQNENDVLKHAHELFFSDNQVKFTLEHAWMELRYDQKWCEFTGATKDGTSKKRRCEKDGPSSPHHTSDDARLTRRPIGVKAAKGAAKGLGKKPTSEDRQEMFQTMWAIKQQDNAQVEKLSTINLLESLVSKKAPLTEWEEALKTKIISDMIGK